MEDLTTMKQQNKHIWQGMMVDDAGACMLAVWHFKFFLATFNLTEARVTLMEISMP